MAALAVPVVVEVGAGIWGFLSAIGGALLISAGIGAAQQIGQGGSRQETGADPSPELNPPSPSDYPGGTPPVEPPWETPSDLPQPEPGWIRW